MFIKSFLSQILLASCTVTAGFVLLEPVMLHAQAATVNTSQSGMVTAITATSVTISTKANGDQVIVPGEGTRFLQVSAGATDLKSATPATLADIAVGDKLLVSGRAGPSSFAAVRIVVLKSGDIASLHAQQAADWQRRGTGGLVRQVSGTTLTVANGVHTLAVSTTPTTIFRRYAGDSIRFEDAKPGTLGDIRPGDQLRVRGAKSEDGGQIAAEEIVSGSFENLAGVLSAVDVAQGTVTLKDLATKKTVVVRVTPNSEIRHLLEMAAAAYVRAHSPNAAPAAAPAEAGPRRGGMDLSQMMPRLPAEALSELKVGDAVLIVASEAPGAVTAVTLLSGVEPILSASPSGAAPTLSPWNLAVPEGSGGAQ